MRFTFKTRKLLQLYEADNDPSEEGGKATPPAQKSAAQGNKRIAASAPDADLEEDLDGEPEKKRSKK